ncbi:DUF6212 domain-containing protein [Paracoccus sp. T5]|uniref:DUF6212 domain-containing protein n=1 Tax=Paracoccus sp. T5 TaxID=3402161 RepID=UPI003ADFEE79
MTMDSRRFGLFVDPDIAGACQHLLPPPLVAVPASVEGDAADLAPAPGRAWLAALVGPSKSSAWRGRLDERGMADVAVIEVDPTRPENMCRELLTLLGTRLDSYEQQMGETRLASAVLRRENQSDKTRFREIESFLYSLGNPQIARSLSWEPSGAIRRLSGEATVVQNIPLNAVSITALDLWLPEMPRNRDLGLSLAIIDAAGTSHDLIEAYGGAETQGGWVRFLLDAPLKGDARDCSLVLRYTGNGTLTIGMGPHTPDRNFAARGDGMEEDEALALRVWKAIAGASLPEEPAAMLAGSSMGGHARFLSPASLPAPELFAKPASATDYVTADYWENEDVVMVHPSRSGAVCAVIRDVPLPRLSHISAIVTVGHPQAPNLNMAVGVAPAGSIGRDGLWQTCMGPWVHGLPALGWAQAHCVPATRINGRADIFLAVSLAQDVPNDLSWGLFRGFRVVTADPLDDAQI